MTDTNQASEDELERKLMSLFARSAEFGRVFLTSATKEEFAESIRAGALDHQEAAHEAMKLIIDWHNKQIEAVLDRLTVADNISDRACSEAIEAERAKLKEVK